MMGIENAAGVELPSRHVLQLVKKIPAPLLRGIRKHLGMDIADQSQVFEFQPLQPVIVKIDMDNPFKRDPGVYERAHALVRHVCLSRAAHARNDSCGIALLKVIDGTSPDVFGNPEFVEFAHDFSNGRFHVQALYHAVRPTVNRCGQVFLPQPLHCGQEIIPGRPLSTSLVVRPVHFSSVVLPMYPSHIQPRRLVGDFVLKSHHKQADFTRFLDLLKTKVKISTDACHLAYHLSFNCTMVILPVLLSTLIVRRHCSVPMIGAMSGIGT